MDDLDRALADLDAAKTGQRRAREEVADLQLLLLQSRAENKVRLSGRLDPSRRHRAGR